MKKIRVVHLLNDLSLGGAQKLVSELIASSRPNIEQNVVILKHRAPFFEDKIKSMAEVHCLSPFKLTSFRHSLRILNNADLIHVHLFPSLYIALIFNKPKIFTEHNTWNRRRNWTALRWIERWVYSKYDLIACISVATYTMLEDWLGRDPKRKLTMVSNGVDHVQFTPRGEVDLRNPVIGMVGRFSKQKDQLTLIRALSILSEDTKLSLAGEGECMESAKNLARQLGVLDRVNFAGNVTDVNGFLDEVDIYVQSSHWEGFGLSALEAMCKGIPTIGSNVSGLSEVIGCNELLFTAGSHLELVEIIERIIAGKTSYHRTKRLSLENAKNFTMEKTTAKYAKIYEDLVSQVP